MYFKKQKEAVDFARENHPEGADLYYNRIRSRYFILPVRSEESPEEFAIRVLQMCDKFEDGQLIKRVY